MMSLPCEVDGNSECGDGALKIHTFWLLDL